MDKNSFKKDIEVSRDNFYVQHIRIVNSIVPESMMLSKTEIKVLAYFMSLTGDLARVPFSTTGKKTIRDKLSMSHSSLSHHLVALHDKKYISGKTSTDIIYPVFKPVNSIQHYQFSLTLKNDK